MKNILAIALSAMVLVSVPTPALSVSNVKVSAKDLGKGKDKQIYATAYLDVPPQKVWKAITSYSNYRHFMPRVSSSKIETRKGNVAIATMKLDVPFPFNGTWYTNRYTENPKAMTVQWKMLKGSLKSNSGGWTLKPQGKGTLATYRVTTDPGVALIPSWVVNQVTKRTVPNIFKGVERRAKSL